MGTLNLKLEGPIMNEHGDGRWSDSTALNICQRLLEPSGDLTVPEAANLFVELLLDKATENREAAEGSLCQFVEEIAEQLPYTHAGHAKLARLMTSLATSSKTTYVVKVEGSFEKTRNFYILRRELGLSVPAYFEEPAECPEYLNQVAFFAHLTNERFFPDLCWTLDPFETAFERMANPDLAAWKMDCSVSAAAIWIIIAGQTIWNQLVGSPIENLSLRQFKPTKLGLERWTLWRKGFEAIVSGERAGLGEEAKGLSKKAASLMLAIEESMTWD